MLAIATRTRCMPVRYSSRPELVLRELFRRTLGAPCSLAVMRFLIAGALAVTLAGCAGKQTKTVGHARTNSVEQPGRHPSDTKGY